MLMSVYSRSGANPHTLSCLMNLQHGSCTIDIDGMGDPGEIKVEFKAISGITWACGNIRTKCLCASSDTSTCSIPQACSSSRFTFLKASRCSLRRCRAIRSCFCMALWRCSLGSEACAGSGSSSSSNNPCSAGSTLRTRHLDLIASRAAVRGVLPSPTTMHVVLVSERRVISARWLSTAERQAIDSVISCASGKRPISIKSSEQRQRRNLSTWALVRLDAAV